jgi:hypothetical protein
MQVPVVRRLALALVMVGVTACGTRETAPQPEMTLEEIAAAWSGGRADPTCRSSGPRGEYLGPVPGAEHCQWPTVTRGAEWGTVTGLRDAVMGLTSLTWERSVPDTSAAARLADSLGTALTRHGLTAYLCPEGGHRWQQPGLGVQYVLGPLGADGRVRVTVFATTLTESLPELLCPGAPKLPAEGSPPARPPAAT